MDEFYWNSPNWIFYAIALFLLLMTAGHFIELFSRKKMERFSESTRFKLALPTRWQRALVWLFQALAIFFIALCLADPRYGKESHTRIEKGRDIVFILDVSRSMLAKDMTPSRLERAKEDIIEGAARMEGHRFGLVLFAGGAKVACPLTFDFHQFSRILNQASPDMVSQGGTNLGDAVRKALSLVKAGARLGNYKDFVLLTDGQDLEGFYGEAALEARKNDIGIYTVGIGQTEPVPIPLGDGRYLEHDGKQVTTQLNESTLIEISSQSAGGSYHNLLKEPRWLNIILDDLEKKEQNRLDANQAERGIPRFVWTLIPALFFWSLSFITPQRSKKQSSKRAMEL